MSEREGKWEEKNKREKGMRQRGEEKGRCRKEKSSKKGKEEGQERG